MPPGLAGSGGLQQMTLLRLSKPKPCVPQAPASRPAGVASSPTRSPRTSAVQRGARLVLVTSVLSILHLFRFFFLAFLCFRNKQKEDSGQGEGCSGRFSVGNHPKLECEAQFSLVRMETILPQAGAGLDVTPCIPVALGLERGAGGAVPERGLVSWRLQFWGAAVAAPLNAAPARCDAPALPRHPAQGARCGLASRSQCLRSPTDQCWPRTTWCTNTLDSLVHPRVSPLGNSELQNPAVRGPGQRSMLSTGRPNGN